MRQLSDCLAPLLAKCNWVIWKRVPTDTPGEFKKVPFQALKPDRYASVTNPATWSTYARAVAHAPHDGGIGFVLLGSGIGALDLDRCIHDDIVDRWAQELIDASHGAYVEITPSGKGLRIIGKAEGKPVHRGPFPRPNGSSVEVWRSCEQFLTLTGRELGRCRRLPNIDDLIDQLVPPTSVHSGDDNFKVYPEKYNAKAVIKKYRYREVNIDWEVAEGWRSDVYWKIGRGLRKLGANESEVAAVILASRPWLDKYGRHSIRALTKEVQRIFTKPD
jgi:primase-polymerase (primpol)-like protein